MGAYTMDEERWWEEVMIRMKMNSGLTILYLTLTVVKEQSGLYTYNYIDVLFHLP